MDLASRWTLEPGIDFLNHGSFGACPREVLDVQRVWRDRLESEPVRFLARELGDLLDEARAVLGRFVGADPDDLAFVPNATTGLATVLRSLRFAAGDELLATDHEYNAAVNALRFAAERDGATVRIVRLPFPIGGPEEIEAAILGAAGPRTRLVLVSHVSGPTALIMPIARVVAGLAELGIDTLVDGAHAPGMVPLDLAALDAAYYVGNGHKWLYGPKGSAFLHVRRDRQASIHPLAISHGANDPRTDRSRFRLEADWTGTADPTPYLSLPAAVAFGERLRPGGWPATMAADRELARAGRDRLCKVLGIGQPAPDPMIGAMATLPLPGPAWPPDADPLQARLFDRHRIEVPIGAFPVPAVLAAGEPPRSRLVRISAAPYNRPEQYERLADALLEELGEEAGLGRPRRP